MSADGVKILAYGSSRLYVSEDGGVTWTVRGPGANYAFCVAVSADGSRMVAAGTYQQTVFVSTDGFRTWTATGSTMSKTGIAISANGLTVLTGNASGGQIDLSTDGGMTWTAKGDFYSWRAFAVSNAGVMAAAYTVNDAQGRVHISKDGGMTWAYSLYSELPPLKVGVSSDGNMLLAVDASGTASVSINQGASWRITMMPANTPSAASVAADGQRAVISAYYTYTTENAGLTWTKETGAPNGGISTISANGERLASVASGASVYTGRWPRMVAQAWKSMYIGATPVIALYLGAKQFWAKP
jgi:hypothetical protein